MDINEREQLLTEITEMNKSDYFTFNELNKHKYLLYCLFTLHYDGYSFKTKYSIYGEPLSEGSFIAGCNLYPKKIMYFIPDEYWDLLPNSAILTKAPEWVFNPEEIMNVITDYIKSKANEQRYT